MKTALITGTTSGIGLATAQLLDKKGWQVFAGVLPGEDTTSLETNTSENTTILPLDITRTEMIYDAIKRITAITGENGLNALVNNAGMAITGPMETLPMAAIRKQMDVNYFGHVEVTQAALPLIRKASGRIVNITSILGRLATPFSGPYCSSKFAMEAFTDVLRMELKPWGIHVIAIEPTAIKTGIWQQTRDFQEEMQSEMSADVHEKYGQQMQAQHEGTHQLESEGISPAHVAETIHTALTARSPKTRYGVGKNFGLYAFLGRFVPDKLRDRILQNT